MSADYISQPISAIELHAALLGDGELALLDVREPGAVSRQGSLLLAVGLPLSQLEQRIARLVPRRTTPVVVFDRGGGETLAARAARRLSELGYRAVRVLDGGVEGWRSAGLKVHTGGSQVLGQAFGEYVEAWYATPHVTVAEVRERIAAGEDVVLVDSRPRPEFEVHSLPDGGSVPGAELVYRSADLIASPDALVVVNCAGRTRSIVGAQALINAGLPNRVVALEGGTMAWRLAGHDLVHGASRAAGEPSERALQTARNGAKRIAERFEVRTIDHETLRRFEADENRSLYLLDVRTPEEFARGHLAGAWSAPSWDIAPWVFRHVATRNARIVLVDEPDLVRATVTAPWLIQLGWGDVFVLDDGHLEGEHVADGEVDEIGPEELQRRLETGQATVVDFAPSAAFRAGHIPRARFAIRSRLEEVVEALPAGIPIVATSDDGVLAKLAVAELAALTDRSVSVLAGGTAAWRAAGLALEEGGDEADDVVVGAWQRSGEEQLEGFRAYLSWEQSRVAELEQDDTTPFRVFR